MSKKVPYTTSDGITTHATILKVDVNLKGLSSQELQVVGHLSKATNAITPIYAQQQFSQTVELLHSLLQLQKRIKNPKHKIILRNYINLYLAKNSPWAITDGKGMRFDLPENIIPKNHAVQKHLSFLHYATQAPPARAIYPSITTPEELAKLNHSNLDTCVIRTSQGKLKTITNAQRYKKELNITIKHLQNAITHANPSLKSYLQTLIKQLQSSSPKDHLATHKKWLKVQGDLHFLLGTAIETYLDRVKGARGTAQASVSKINHTYQDFCTTMTSLLPEFEKLAPWKYKKKITKKNIPQLKFLDVITWAGGYDAFPATVLAECLPNEASFRKKFGSVNAIFVNIQQALDKAPSSSIIQREFLPKSILSKYQHLLSHLGLIMTASHELGHASGGTKGNLEPAKVFGKEYSALEEARAELFSMWVLPILAQKNIITQDQLIAGYYNMLLSMIRGCASEPNDHAASRNMMFHYFLEKKAIIPSKNKFKINPASMQSAVTQMLKTLANFRAEGNIQGYSRFKQKYCKTDRKAEFEHRLSALPKGRLLIFPTLEKKGKLFTSKILYPKRFADQPRLLNHFL